ncbi:TonB-dependent receptor [Stenotrophomonas sp. MMGLT7]|uniref:TonB-dependent receptor n=1 Tax=Stenotrophomonas sp. MMGLT7 TaxID=2901227 RepID=UPI001E508D81|nr:TonB-dependent receptor [Stenotrophomonas sp. MMGLT7]
MAARPLSRVLRQVLLAGAGGLAALPALVQAQDGGEGGYATQLDAVTVTAQKRIERIQDVPMAISVLNAQHLAAQGQVQLTDYFAQVPGLSMNARGSGRNQLLIRGIAAGTEQNPTVGVIVDDVPFGSSTTDIQVPDIDPADMERIEVLKGPQGTLYGASSMGGLLKYVTLDPETDAFSGRAQLDASTTAHGGEGYGGRAAFNLPLVEDVLALRVSAYDRQDPGYIRDLQQGRDEINEARVKGARVSALWNAGERTTVRLAAMAQNAEADGTANADVDFDHVPAYGGYARMRMAGTDGYENKVRLYNLKVNADLDWADFDSISSYGEYDYTSLQDVSATFSRFTGIFLGVPNAGVTIDNDSRTEKYTQEFRLSSKGDAPLGWQVGAYYAKEDTTGYQALRGVDPDDGANLGYAPFYQATALSRYEEKALYGDIDYQFSDRFDIQVGGRYSDVGLQARTVYDGPMAGGPSVDSDPSGGEKVFTYLFSPRFKLDADSILYARVASGYRAGGLNGTLLGDFPQTYDSDTLVSYELGYKGIYLDNLLAWDLSAFYIDWSDMQIGVVDQATSISYTDNAGKASSSGIESSLTYRPLDGLELTWNAAYTDAKLEQDLPNGTFGRKGDRLPYSARFTSNLNATLNFPLGSLYGFVGGGVNYVGSRLAGFNSSAATARFVMPSYTTLDLRAGVEAERWALSFYVKNLTDEYAFLSATARNATTGQSLYGVGILQPRTFGTSFSWNF